MYPQCIFCKKYIWPWDNSISICFCAQHAHTDCFNSDKYDIYSTNYECTKCFETPTQQSLETNNIVFLVTLFYAYNIMYYGFNFISVIIVISILQIVFVLAFPATPTPTPKERWKRHLFRRKTESYPQ